MLLLWIWVVSEERAVSGDGASWDINAEISSRPIILASNLTLLYGGRNQKNQTIISLYTLLSLGKDVLAQERNMAFKQSGSIRLANCSKCKRLHILKGG